MPVASTDLPSGVALQPGELLALSGTPKRFPPPRRRHPARSGPYLSKIRGRGMEFDEARPYQPGDDVRSIDWRVTARSGRLHTKLFHEELERPVLVVVDGDDSMRFGTRTRLKSVQACRYAARVAWSALARGDRVGAVLGGPDGLLETRPQSRRPHLLTLLQRMGDWHNRLLQAPESAPRTTEHPLLEALRVTRRVAPTGSLVYVVSDWKAADDAVLQTLGTLKRHHELRAIRIYDGLEEQLPHSGTYPVWSSGTRSEVVWLDCSQVDLREQHQRRATAERVQLEEAMRHSGVPLLSVRTDEDVQHLPLH